MKRNTLYTILALVMALMGIHTPGVSQLLLNENFDYVAGTPLTANGWVQTGTTATNPILVSTAGLTYTGYPGSGIGNAADMVTTGQDVNNPFTMQTTGTVYAGFLVSVSASQTTGDYFFHFIESPVTGNIFKGRIWIKKDASTTNFAFGLSKSSTTATQISYTGFDYLPGTTYLLVMKYEFNAATTTDDNLTLYIGPATGSPEPATPTLTYIDNTSTDALNIAMVALRQGTTANAPTLRIDGIRVGTSWNDVMGSAVILPPTIQAHDISFSAVTATSLTSQWTSGNGSKRIAVINTTNSFTNPADGSDPVANPVYGGSGEQVIYNGSSNIVSITGLVSNTTYWFRVYEYNGTGTSTKYLTSVATLNPNSQTTLLIATPPVISGPTVASVTNVSALLGGNITGNGGAPILERGTVWGTSPGVTFTSNKLAEGGTATGVFSHVRSGLPVKSKIYFKAYATNVAGTSLTDESSFFTLATEPTSHVNGFTATTGGNTSINLNWTAPATGADGYIILLKTGAVAPTGIPADGTGYSEGENLGDGMVAALVEPASTLNKSITGLSSGTTYSFTIFPFAWDGVNFQTYNYRTSPVIPAASATTTGTASNVYTWSGPDNGVWTTAGNWTPARITPAPEDVLQFNDGTTKTITGVITQTVSRIVLGNNTIINLQSSATTGITITGGAGPDLYIPAGCALNFNAVNAITMTVASGATGLIYGNMRFSSTANTQHRLIGQEPGSVVFGTGSVFHAGTFFLGNPFGTSSLNSVVFASGSTYLQQAGSNPFGAAQPNSVVVFEAGSLFKVIANLTPSFSGRIYANFEVDAPGVTLSPTGTTPVSIDDLTISNGTFNFNMTGPSTGAHQIRGHVTVQAGAVLTFNPAAAGTVSFSSGGDQQMTISGTLNQNANSTFEVSGGTHLMLNTPVNINGHLKLTEGVVVTGNNTLTLAAASTLTGTFSSTAMIVPSGSGQFVRTYPAGFTGSILLPVGDITGTADYTPVNLNFTSGTFGAGSKIGISLENAKYPSDPNNVNYLNRYWNLTSTGITGISCDLTCQYLPADVTGNESEMFAMQVLPLPFTSYGLANTGLHQLHFSGITSFGSYTGSQPAPNVQTTAATLVGATTATLTGLVIANYLPTSISFEYGTTTAYGTVVQGIPATVGGGGSNSALANISGLTQNTTYHFRIIGTSLQGTSYGNDLTFTTTCPAPDPGGSITGPSSVCLNGSGYVYTVPAIPNATSYNWILPAGATIALGNGTNSITVNYSLTAVSGNITVSGTGVCGTGNPSPPFAVTVHPLPVPVVTGPTTACINSSGNVYSTDAGMTGYTWSISSGGVITGGAGTNSVIVTWNTIGAQSLSVIYTNANGCTNATPVTYNINVVSLPVPTITGPNVVCANAAGIVYTTEPGMANYNWAVSIGGTITAGQGTNAITVLWPYAGQRTVNVSYTTPAGCAAASPTTYNVTINPAAVPTIGGTTVPCVNSVNNQYITNAGMQNYFWEISPGGTITSGQYSNTVMVAWNAVGAQWLKVSYTNTYGCATVTPTLYSLFVNPLPNAAGPITGENALCAGTQGVVYTCPEVLNATSYQWNLPAGAVITSGSGTNTITVNFSSSASSGTITVAGVNECGAGTSSPDFSVTVKPLPPTPVVTATGSYLASNAPSGNQWYFEGNPIPNATGSVYLATQTGYYWCVVTLNGCSSAISNKVYVLILGTPENATAPARVFPNPNDGRFRLTIPPVSGEGTKIRIFNSLGIIVYEEIFRDLPKEQTITIDLGQIPAGMYMLTAGDREMIGPIKFTVTR